MHDKATTTRLLMQSERFTETDLNDNRAGRISSNQRRKFGASRATPLVQAVLLAHFFGVIALLLLIAITSESIVMLGITLAIAAVLALPFSVMSSGHRRPALNDDLARGAVSSLCGIAVLERKQGIRAPRYTLAIHNESFDIAERTFRTLQHGERYCVYYLPNSKALLSIEPD